MQVLKVQAKANGGFVQISREIEECWAVYFTVVAREFASVRENNSEAPMWKQDQNSRNFLSWKT